MPDNPSVSSPRSPEPQTVGRCAKLRGEIFGHIDRKHGETQKCMATNQVELLKELGEIKEKAAYRNGMAAAASGTSKNPPVKEKKVNWEKVAAAIVLVSAAIAAAIAAIK